SQTSALFFLQISRESFSEPVDSLEEIHRSPGPSGSTATSGPSSPGWGLTGGRRLSSPVNNPIGSRSFDGLFLTNRYKLEGPSLIPSGSFVIHRPSVKLCSRLRRLYNPVRASSRPVCKPYTKAKELLVRVSQSVSRTVCFPNES